MKVSRPPADTPARSPRFTNTAKRMWKHLNYSVYSCYKWLESLDSHDFIHASHFKIKQNTSAMYNEQTNCVEVCKVSNLWERQGLGVSVVHQALTKTVVSYYQYYQYSMIKRWQNKQWQWMFFHAFIRQELVLHFTADVIIPQHRKKDGSHLTDRSFEQIWASRPVLEPKTANEWSCI